MKYLVLIAVAVVAGMFGGYIGHENNLGATAARTTITSPWTFSATTTMNGNLTLTTTNTATSSAQVGCIQTTATSTVTPIRFVIGNTQAASTTFQGSNSNFTVLAQYGSCPRI
jgi:hypothetical protein